MLRLYRISLADSVLNRRFHHVGQIDFSFYGNSATSNLAVIAMPANVAILLNNAETITGRMVITENIKRILASMEPASTGFYFAFVMVGFSGLVPVVAALQVSIKALECCDLFHFQSQKKVVALRTMVMRKGRPESGQQHHQNVWRHVPG